MNNKNACFDDLAYPIMFWNRHNQKKKKKKEQAVETLLSNTKHCHNHIL